MVIIHGEPISASDSITQNFDWNACVGYCYNTPKCAAVHQDEQVSGCRIFEIGKIMQIKQLDAYSGKMMAVKMLSNTTTCPASSFDNSMFYQIQTNTTYQNYSITVEDDIWTFTTTPFYYCPDNFKLFFRPRGLWCIGIISMSGVSQNGGSGVCKNRYGGVLSGYDSLAEIRYVVDSVVPLVAANTSYKWDAYWINGIRKDTCKYRNQTGSDCDGTKGFNLTDPLLSSDSFYGWGSDGKPDGMNDNLGNSNCVAQRIGKTTGGGLDDYPCFMTSITGEMIVKGYICGAAPKEEVL